MRFTTLATIALIAVSATPGVPAMAKDFNLHRAITQRATHSCMPPAQWVNVCTSWAKGEPGTLVGKCLSSRLECQTAPVLH
jgi:hypothetical protein